MRQQAIVDPIAECLAPLVQSMNGVVGNFEFEDLQRFLERLDQNIGEFIALVLEKHQANYFVLRLQKALDFIRHFIVPSVSGTIPAAKEKVGGRSCARLAGIQRGRSDV
jgi:hypothetical protein